MIPHRLESLYPAYPWVAYACYGIYRGADGAAEHVFGLTAVAGACLRALFRLRAIRQSHLTLHEEMVEIGNGGQVQVLPLSGLRSIH